VSRVIRESEVEFISKMFPNKLKLEKKEM